MGKFKIGIVSVDEHTSFVQRNMAATIESLKALGCSEQNILVRHAPRLTNVAMVVQFFAEYTDVDAVVVLTERDDSAEYATMLYAVSKLQIMWNMPVVIGDCTTAADAIDLVTVQTEMEAAAPEHTAPDRKSIN
ncbi:MAG: 6,7-dimethyl-8-ribityllumazine synthase [Alistipes sp.]|nr:6,7-dimethyl-8-ribityllumazine synthase [Alistipes sp.]